MRRAIMFGWFKRRQSAAVNGPDFSAIDSPARAEQAVRRGELETLFMMPLEFGGAEIPQNTLHVPPWVPAAKASFDNDVIRPLVEEGLSIQYSVIPEYQSGSRSLVPIAITTVWAKPGDAQSSTCVIKIWGEALTRDADA
jgi:hypothetical protein